VLGLLPLPDSSYNVVWSVSLPLYDLLINLSDHDFISEINSRLQSSSDQNFTNPPLMTSQIRKRFGFYLSTSNLENYYNGSKVVFLGDSAHTIHPMIGQGLNLGIQDAKTLGYQLQRNMNYGLGLSAKEGLLEFEKEAKLRNYNLQMTVEALKIMYQSPWVEDVRQMGTKIIELSPGIREQMYRIANSF
jgi:2-polyprenyl-6-methoxyphenol hydroxylase-like FAD-dependent oxidoreductase